jgi:hypothetical protein
MTSSTANNYIPIKSHNYFHDIYKYTARDNRNTVIDIKRFDSMYNFIY